MALLQRPPDGYVPFKLEMTPELRGLSYRFGFNGLGELTYRRTYSRLKPNGTKEDWPDTVERVVNGTYNMQKRWVEQCNIGWKPRKAQRSASEMFNRILQLKFSPPGRGLWAMGSPLTEERGLFAALNNCFSGETELWANGKLVQFKELFAEFKDERITVLAGDGVWREATVSSFGRQALQRVTVGPCGIRSNFNLAYDVTPDHRWILEDGTETTKLNVGDVVGVTQTVVDKDHVDYKVGFDHGVLFKCGLSDPDDNGTIYVVVPDDKSSHLDLLKQIPHCVGSHHCDRDEGGTTLLFKLPRDVASWKALPLESSSFVYQAAFLEGLISTCAREGDFFSLHTRNLRDIDWLTKRAPQFGYCVTHLEVDDLGLLNSQVTHIFDGAIGVSFASVNHESNRIVSGAQTTESSFVVYLKRSPVHYQVESIEDQGRVEDVFCVTEPVTRSFTLVGGLVTGNCGFTSTDKAHNVNPMRPYTFLMDGSMLGIGIGFDTRGKGQQMVHRPNPDPPMVYVITDDREGWVESVRLLLQSYFEANRPLVKFEYHLIRPAGDPIKTFGGTSAGYKVLENLHDALRKTLDAMIGKLMDAGTIVDLMNHIGVCVVAGNVRRTAELALGDADDEQYINLKNYELNPHRVMYGRISNNSVIGHVGMDYSQLAELIQDNGEPGIFWLDNVQKFGLMNGVPDNRDHRALGTNPCSEQTLEPYELCCLVETFPTRCENIDDFARTLKFAYMYAKTVTLGNTHWVETNRVLMRNRRIGCSMSGITTYIDQYGVNTFRELCRVGYEVVQKYDRIYSDWFAVPRSIKTTSVKPSGTVSLLAGVPPGCHWPISRFYLRRITFDKDNVLVPVAKKHGYLVEVSVYEPDRSVFICFPVDEGEGVRAQNDVSMWEKLQLAALLQEKWSDNQVSCTIHFDKVREGPQIQQALQYFQYFLKSISFLGNCGKSDYPQLPYEPITEEEYKQHVSRITPLSAASFAQVAMADAEAERGCEGDKCDLTVRPKPVRTLNISLGGPDV